MSIAIFVEDNEMVPYCICVKVSKITGIFWYSDEIITNFLRFVSENSKKNSIEIFTHNINYDGLIIINALKDKNIVIDMFIRSSNLYWVSIIFMKVYIKIRCSFKIIPLSLEILSKLMNKSMQIFPYKFVNRRSINYLGAIPSIDYFNSETDYYAFKEKFTIFDLQKTAVSYYINNIEILSNVLENLFYFLFKFCDKNVMQKCHSFSSLSYKIFKKEFDKHNITKIKISVSEDSYIRNAYYGGRCEVFGNPWKDEIVHYFDFKGMYAQCMKEKFPCDKGKIDNTNLSIENVGFHTIEYECDDYVPFLPNRLDKLFFLNGRQVGTYWYEEIVNAVKKKKCKIIKHHASYIYRENDYIFAEYVDKFMKIREKGAYYNIFGKNMINGLYGSFALNSENYVSIVILNDYEFKMFEKYTEILSYKKIGNLYIVNINKDAKSNKYLDKKNFWDNNHKIRNIAYAAIIASKARVKLNNSLDDVIKDGGRLLYTDTDSIFAAYKENKLNQKLNEITWSKTYENGVFIADKFYCLKDKNVEFKSIKNDNFLTYDQIEEIFYDNKEENILLKKHLQYKELSLESFGICNNKRPHIFKYNKRLFVENKKNTRPIWYG